MGTLFPVLRRSAFFCFPLLLCLLLFPSQPASSTSRPVATTARVQDVIDGDTIVLETGEHLRYIGVDAPEIRRKIGGQWIYAPEPLGEEAKAYNRRLVGGKTIALQFDREREDRYGRMLGYVYVEGTFVNAKLLEDGYARLLVFPPNTRHADLFWKLEKTAMKEHRGIWGLKGRR